MGAALRVTRRSTTSCRHLHTTAVTEGARGSGGTSLILVGSSSWQGADMYGVLSRVPAPIEAYDASHAEIGRRSQGKADGLLVHVGRATPDGFEVLEVWES